MALRMASQPASMIASKSEKPKSSYVLFVCALAVGIVEIVFPRGYAFGPGYEMAGIARNLAQRGFFGNPFEPWITGPTAVVPPLYPLLMAPAMKLLDPPWSFMFIALTNAICNAISAALMPRISSLLFGNRLPGVVAGVLAILSLRVIAEWDAGFTLCALLLYVTATLSYAQSGRFSPKAVVSAGIAAGVIANANPATLLVSVPWMFYVTVYAKWPPRAAVLKNLLLFASMFVLAILPWIARNYRLLGAPVVRTNLGMTVYASNNDCAKASMAEDEDFGCYRLYHPSVNPAEIALLSQLGEVEYDRQRTAAAFAWVRSHPAQFVDLTLARIGRFWFPLPVTPFYPAFGIGLATLLSIPGIVLMLKRRISFAWAVLFAYGVFPLMYYVVVTDERYRYPILWCSLLAGGYCVSHLASVFGVTKPQAEV